MKALSSPRGDGGERPTSEPIAWHWKAWPSTRSDVSTSRVSSGITVAEPPAVSRNHLPTYALVVVIGLWAMIQMVNNRSPGATTLRAGSYP
ncbi:MAG: hypothetical protein IPG43_04940 [Proteobacteria bacterium]|nr:hypothetical protein [Pseudomonadota bacterium]